MTETLSVQWWFASQGTSEGPLSTEQIEARIASGQVPLNSLVCRVGETRWKPIPDVPEFAAKFPPRSPPLPSTRVADPAVPGFGVWDMRLQRAIGWLFLAVVPSVDILSSLFGLVIPTRFAENTPQRETDDAIAISWFAVWLVLTVMGAWGGYRLLRSRSDSVDWISAAAIFGFANTWAMVMADLVLTSTAGPETFTPQFTAHQGTPLDKLQTAMNLILSLPLGGAYLVALMWCWNRRPMLLEADRRRLFPQATSIPLGPASTATMSPSPLSTGTSGAAN